jgi:hypothetical protein
VPEYSRSSATPTDRCSTALKKNSCAPATANAPYPMTAPALRRSSAQRPRSCRIAGMVRTSAATVMRAVTAAPGDHPAFISDVANEPDVPKVAADSTARPRPTLLVRIIRLRP